MDDVTHHLLSVGGKSLRIVHHPDGTTSILIDSDVHGTVVGARVLTVDFVGTALRPREAGSSLSLWLEELA